MAITTLDKQQVRKLLPKDTYPFVAEAMDQGFQAMRGGKHLKLKKDDSSVVVATSPSDYRDIRNLQSDLIKAGVDLSTTKKAARKRAVAKKSTVTKKVATTKARIAAPAVEAKPKAADVTSDKPLHSGKSEEVYNASEIIELIVEGYKPEEVFTPTEIREVLIDSDFKVKTTGMGNVHEKIGRMLADGKIIRVGRGQYKRVHKEEPVPEPEVVKEDEPSTEDVLEALKEIPLKVPVSDSRDPMARINEAFSRLEEEVKKISTSSSRFWYAWFEMCNAREHMENAVLFKEGDEPF